MGSTFKTKTLAGESTERIEDAVPTALKTSVDAVYGQTWMQVEDIRANLGDNAGIDRRQASVHVAFRVNPDR